jgi:threonylcarbamoyladenosine tRNA methylthiotransferase MtaB
MSGRPIASILTLGCKLNLADSEEIARGLRAAGYEVVDHLCEASAVVVNTCSVTHVADRKSRRLIRSVRRTSPAAAVAVTGCFPQSTGFEAARELGADFVGGTRDADKDALLSFLQPSPEEPGSAGAPGSLHTRAFIKAQEGCNDVCAFCIVPRTRGREESRTAEAVSREVEAAVEGGAREAIITGTQLGAWGRDFDVPLKPHHLIGAVLERSDVARLRFSSLQPQDITPEILALWSDPRLMPHFHLALQSGSDSTLTAMRRRYTSLEFLQAVERIRAAVPTVAITTDVIAGFPGETEADFAETLSLCRAAGFARIHAFPYSQRARTTAARMPEQVPPDVRTERLRRVVELGGELSERFRLDQAGTTRPVLWESERIIDCVAAWFGHTDNYIPVFMAGSALGNRVTPVTIGGLLGEGVRGIPVGGAA